MNILFTTLNSKFIHSNLALKYISKCIDAAKVRTKEYTINEDIEEIFFDIIQGGYDLVAFSCYIWNIEKTLKIINNLKKARPDIKILLGGPEVSYDVTLFLEKHPEVELVIAGEGEEALRKLNEVIRDYNSAMEQKQLYAESEYTSDEYHAEKRSAKDLVHFLDQALSADKIRIPNLYLNMTGDIKNYSDAKSLEQSMVVRDLSLVPDAYTDIRAEDIQNKIVYYETSRGCNYNCAYCLSATQKGIRFFEEERVFKELKRLVELGAKQIKFVDRTFNSDPVRTRNLMEFIKTIDNGEVNFHFEITAHLLTSEQIEMLSSARTGLFQLEIGVQSTNEDTLIAVNRGNYFERLSDNVLEIKKAGNIHQHLDLIAGLPYENLERFKKSFNDVFALRPEMLQLGFLKFLKGSPIYSQIEKYDYKFRDYPPYEVISNRFISFEDLIELKAVENVLDRYYNKQRYQYAASYILSYYSDGYTMFKALADIIKEHNIELNQKNEEFRAMLLLSEKLYSELLQGKNADCSIAHEAAIRDACISYNHDFFVELLRMDYLMMGRNPNLPDFLKSRRVATKEYVFDLLSVQENLMALGFERGTTPKEAFKKINWAIFDYDVIVYYNTSEVIKKNNIVLINYGLSKTDMESFKHIRRGYDVGN